MAGSTSSVDKVCGLFYGWFPYRAEIFLASGLVVIDEISTDARSLFTNLLPAVRGILK
jgi:hypothetical protein